MLNIDYPAQRLQGESSFPRPPFIAVVHDFLSRAECAELVQRIECIGPGAAPISLAGGRQVLLPEVRNNDRVMFEDVSLAASLFERLRPALPVREDTSRLSLRGSRISTRPGKVLLLYLSDGFVGGDTLFNDLNLRVIPRTGMALLFEHLILHEGCAVLGGTKYVLRSDVMYRR